MQQADPVFTILQSKDFLSVVRAGESRLYVTVPGFQVHYMLYQLNRFEFKIFVGDNA